VYYPGLIAMSAASSETLQALVIDWMLIKVRDEKNAERTGMIADQLHGVEAASPRIHKRTIGKNIIISSKQGAAGEAAGMISEKARALDRLCYPNLHPDILPGSRMNFINRIPGTGCVDLLSFAVNNCNVWRARDPELFSKAA
jgi:hypothetical protein